MHTKFNIRYRNYHTCSGAGGHDVLRNGVGNFQLGTLGWKNQFYQNPCKILVDATTSLQQYLELKLTGVSGTLVCQEFTGVYVVSIWGGP